jgi:TPR repeat protein
MHTLALSINHVFITIWTSLFIILSISDKHDGFNSILCALIIPLLTFIVLKYQKQKQGITLGFVKKIRTAHVVQTIAQSIVYIAWISAWQPIYEHLPLLIAQILFAYLVDMLLVWRKYNNYRLGFAPIPVVCSTNLFLFFKPELFMWQWVLIAVAFGSREVFRWQRNGKEIHIFNPSAIALSLAAIILLYTEQMHLSWGAEIARAHGFSSYSYEIIFIAGLLVSTFFTVGFTIASAVIGSILIGEIYFEWVGIYRYVDSSIPIAVFLGMNLLVTDPVTSPHRRDAKCLYGVLYALSVFILYGYLRDLERIPSDINPGLSAAFCDKLLAVPLLNLCAPWLDLFMQKSTRLLSSVLRLSKTTYISKLVKSSVIAKLINKMLHRSTWGSRSLFAILWLMIFIAWVRPSLRDFPGKSREFWDQACQSEVTAQHPYTCENRNRLYRSSCEQGNSQVCHNLASAYEYGEGIKKDLSMAGTLYQKACSAGLLMSCNQLGGLLVQEAQGDQDTKWLSHAWKVLERACQGQLAESCTRQATLLQVTKVQPQLHTEARSQRIVELYQHACTLGEALACRELSTWSMAPPHHRQQGCTQGNAVACMAWQRVQSYAVPPVEARQAELVFVHKELQGACKGKIGVSCAHLAWLYWQGDGVSMNHDQARDYMQQACNLNAPSSCEKLKQMQTSDKK